MYIIRGRRPDSTNKSVRDKPNRSRNPSFAMTTLALSLGITTMLAFSLAGVIAIHQARSHKALQKEPILVAGAIGLLGNISLAFALMKSAEGLIVDLSSTLALFSAILATVGTFTLFSENTRIIGAITYPITAVMSGLALILFNGDTSPTVLTPGVQIHIILSLLAYGLLGLAMAQACAIYLQIRALKALAQRPIIHIFPPLQSMDTILFALLRSGWTLLTLAIASGAIFIEHLFAQQLAHKTVLSCLSWLVFGALILGHKRFGWRGIKAVHWMSAGFALLVLAYFGSKFVLEIILNR